MTKSSPSIVGTKVRLARNMCCRGDCIIAMANEPHAGEFICADCGKHRAWMSHKTARFIEETQRRFDAPEVITVGTPQERGELRNRDYELPDGARIEVVNPAYPPRLYLSDLFRAVPAPNKKGKLSAAKTQAKVIAVGKTYHEIADAIAFHSERYGKHNVHVILKQRQEAPAIKRLDDDGNEIETQSQSANEQEFTMRATDMYPSKYLKSGDVKDKLVTAVISHINVELVGQGKNQEQKPVLYFEGNVKPMVLNKTNAVTLDKAFGDTDNWGGKKVRIVRVETTFGGETVDGIRVKPAAAKPTTLTVAGKPVELADAEEADEELAPYVA